MVPLLRDCWMNRAPWRHPLMSRLNDLPKVRPTFAEAAKQVRNRLRRFSAQSIARHAMIFLQKESTKPTQEEMRTWPWVTLLIVKLVLEDESIALDRGEMCVPEVFDRCRQTIWDAQGASDRKESSPGGVYLMVRAMMQAQLLFQRRISWGFLRWPALIARLAPDHPSRRLFIERLGIEPDTFLCLCYATHVPVVSRSHTMELDSDFAPLRRRFGADVDRFFDEFSRDLLGLRVELQRQRATRKAAGEQARPRRELNEFPWLANYPLLRLPGDRFEVWHPAVFAKGMEEGVHRRLSERRGGYAGDFSKVFERYVLELLNEAGVQYLSEAEYKRALAGDVSAVEAIITADGVNVFIESKLTVYSEDVVVSNQAPVVWQGLKRVREAMQQAWMVGSRLRDRPTPDWECVRATEDFLMVVTSQPVSCATGEHFRRMFKHDVFDPEMLARRKSKAPTAAHLNRLPLKNVLIASIDEFEHLMGGVRDGRIQLVPFFREVAAANADPLTSVMFLDQLIAKKAAEGAPPAVIEQALERADATILALL